MPLPSGLMLPRHSHYDPDERWPNLELELVAQDVVDALAREIRWREDEMQELKGKLDDLPREGEERQRERIVGSGRRLWSDLQFLKPLLEDWENAMRNPEELGEREAVLKTALRQSSRSRGGFS